MKLKNVDEEVRELMEVILRIIKENVDTYMPGFTHLQKAQPVTVAHHFLLTLKCSDVTEADFTIYITE